MNVMKQSNTELEDPVRKHSYFKILIVLTLSFYIINVLLLVFRIHLNTVYSNSVMELYVDAFFFKYLNRMSWSIYGLLFVLIISLDFMWSIRSWSNMKSIVERKKFKKQIITTIKLKIFFTLMALLFFFMLDLSLIGRGVFS